MLTFFSQEKGLLPRITVLLFSFYDLQVKLLSDRCRLAFHLNGSIPGVIFNPVEGVEIGLHPLLKLRKVPVLILVILGDTGKIKGEVSLFEGLPPLVQRLTDLFFIGSMAGP